MPYLVEKANAIFWLFSVPLVSRWLRGFCSSAVIKKILIGATVMMLPIIGRYDCIWPYYYEFVGFVIIVCLIAFLMKGPGWTFPLVSSVFLFFVFSYITFFAAFAGSVHVEKTWKLDKYSVEYIVASGFAGRPSEKYALNKIAFVPIFKRKVDMVYVEDADGCTIEFKRTHVKFDKCQ